MDKKDAQKAINKKKPVQPTTDADVAEKSKKQLKEERRLKQEAQRAAKAALKDASGDQKKKDSKPVLIKSESSLPKEIHVPDIEKVDKKLQQKVAKKLVKQHVPQRQSLQRKVGLFSHLHQYERENSLTETLSFTSNTLHPAIINLGVQYAHGVISGSNARCISLLGVLKTLIQDYSTPLNKELNRDLDSVLKPQISFLSQCRPLSVSMGNAIRFFKYQLQHLKASISEDQAKEELISFIDNFYEEKIEGAGKLISNTAITKIVDGDVLLTYGASSLIYKVFCEAYDAKKKFRVIILDGRPKLEGKEMLKKLVKHGIECSYMLINAASYAMKEATKVFLGVHGLLANGYVMCRIGSGQVALVAKLYNVPVLVCCETYKFCERVQTDSFVFNELGDPNDLVESGTKEKILANWKDIKNLYLLNIAYDVTPPDLISTVITEHGMLPCTSVPVVLRVLSTCFTIGYE